MAHGVWSESYGGSRRGIPMGPPRHPHATRADGSHFRRHVSAHSGERDVLFSPHGKDICGCYLVTHGAQSSRRSHKHMTAAWEPLMPISMRLPGVALTQSSSKLILLRLKA